MLTQVVILSIGQIEIHKFRMSQNRTIKLTNKPSILLNDKDNETLFNSLGKSCVTLATAVIQLYLSEEPENKKWNKRCCGVATFIKDNPQKSYFIRVYDLKTQSMIWEQELYTQFRYKSPRDYFHTFECETVQAGLNFASEDEANLFKSAIEQKLLERSNRRTARKKNTVKSPNPPNFPNISPLAVSEPLTNPNVGKGKERKTSTGSVQSLKKKKFSKEDIGSPSNFTRVAHIGFDPIQGFQMKNMQPEMRRLFESVGITPDDTAVDNDTVEFIYDFVDRHGGINAVNQEISLGPTAIAPGKKTRALPSIPGDEALKPHDPPNRVPPKVPNHKRPAPKPPIDQVRGPGSIPNGPPPPPPPPPIGGGLPPPPPPIIGGGSHAPIPPSLQSKPPVSPQESNNGPRANLMESIRMGMQLNSVETDCVEPVDGDRGSLLKAIQSGANLKKVEHVPTAKRPTVEDGGGIVGALARALAERQRAVHGSDDEDDDIDGIDDDDDWDD
ncbi:actin nucleation-promoting factor WASL [Patella vulgata]|uniref:actin nucleation-promoting factor WASL n=1 Tax=Patella vulgata TaxID=6465 RepID=UPI00217F8B8E|nr:actin nucleation-promoting factor WASL [Patella vulgata]